MNRKLEAGFFLLGLVMFGILLWRLDFSTVWEAVRKVGWGFAFIFAQEIVAHVCNATGWMWTFPGRDRKKISFGELLQMRIAGDSLNYLAPPVTLAGEWARVTMLGARFPLPVRLSSIAVAKVAQAMALGATCTLGMAIWVRGRISLSAFKAQIHTGAWVLAALILAVVLLELRAWRKGAPEPAPSQGPGTLGAPEARGETPAPEAPALGAEPKDPEAPVARGEGRGLKRYLSHAKAADGEARRFLKNHTANFLAAIAFFSLAYLWGGFEAYWICRFLGRKIAVGTALAIEIMSILLDAMLFMVPAKMGTQEATKTAIFACMGYPPATGFAFGIVRHMRELTWSLLGLAAYLHHSKKKRDTSHISPSKR